LETANSGLDIRWDAADGTVAKGVGTHKLADLSGEVLDLVVTVAEELKVVADGLLVKPLLLDVVGLVLAVGELLLDISGRTVGKLVLKVGCSHQEAFELGLEGSGELKMLWVKFGWDHVVSRNEVLDVVGTTSGGKTEDGGSKVVHFVVALGGDLVWGESQTGWE